MSTQATNNARKKKTTTVILSLVLVAVIALGTTLAYLSTVTEQQRNVFTFSENISAGLDEPNWDPNEGKDLVPDAMMRKDPMITNLSDNGLDIYAAIRVNFTDGSADKLSDADALRLMNLITIDWNTADWQLTDSNMEDKGEQIWIYKGEVAPNQITNPLFNSVTIKSKDDYIKDYKIKYPTVADEDIPKWEGEFGWLASTVMDHTQDCFNFGTHDAAKCDPTYKHHSDCALFTGTGTATEIQNTPKDGQVGGKTCDCKPATEHHSKDDADPCPATVPTLKTGADKCAHTSNGIDGFNLVVRGAAVQAGVDGMETWNNAVTIAKLTELFTLNGYTATP